MRVKKLFDNKQGAGHVSYADARVIWNSLPKPPRTVPIYVMTTPWGFYLSNIERMPYTSTTFESAAELVGYFNNDIAFPDFKVAIEEAAHELIPVRAR